MRCHKCYQHEQIKAGSRQKWVCRNCREDDHTSDKNDEFLNESKCENCREGHKAGSNDCENEIKERVIKKSASW